MGVALGLSMGCEIRVDEMEMGDPADWRVVVVAVVAMYCVSFDLEWYSFKLHIKHSVATEIISLSFGIMKFLFPQATYRRALRLLSLYLLLNSL
jgi:hypothetical protein